MEDDRKFAIAFILSFVIVGLFFGSTITGSVVQTSYCTSEGCHAFCSSTSDCYGDGVCCEHFGNGVCVEDCEKEYVASPDTPPLPMPVLENPEMAAVDSGFYLVLLFLITVTGWLYLYARRQPVKSKKKGKKKK